MNYAAKIILSMMLMIISMNALAFDQNNFEKDIRAIMHDYQIPGAAIAVVSGDKVLFKKSFGVRNSKSKEPITSETIFQIASLSKGFIGAVFASLVDNGKISWEDKVSDHIKGFKLADGSDLTFHQVAAMQTGLARAAGSEYLKDGMSRKEIIKSFQNVAPISTSKNFTYQYALMSVMEEAILQKTKLEWQVELQKRILKPLKLYNTGVDIRRKSKSSKNVARPHDENNQVVEWESFKINSAAGMYSNLNDLSKWLQFHLNDALVAGKRIISKQEINNMRKTHTIIDDLTATAVPSDEIKSLSYGYFWKVVNYQINDQTLELIEHSGNCTGMSAIISYIPKEKIGIIILSNKFTAGPEIIRKKFLENLTKNYKK